MPSKTCCSGANQVIASAPAFVIRNHDQRFHRLGSASCCPAQQHSEPCHGSAIVTHKSLAEEFRLEDGGVVFRASGFARPIPGIDPRRNLHGISFAVANMTGFLARAMSLMPQDSGVDAVTRLLRFSALKDELARAI